MAKHKRGRKKGRHRRKGMRGLGSTLVVRRGLGRAMMGQGLLGAILPPAIGVGVAALTVIGIRHLAKPEEGADATQTMLWKNAGLFGLGAGAVASVALYMLGGSKAAAGAAVGALGVGAAVMASDYFAKTRPAALASLAGLGAIVPEYAGMQGLGAVVMSPALQGARGEEVSLGAINPAAFGTPGFVA